MSLEIDPLDVIGSEAYGSKGVPHEVWTRLRNESPVHWCEPPGYETFWAITKHADITEIGKNPELFISSPTLFIPFEDEPEGVERFEAPPTLISMDPPQHHKQRQIINKRFTPRAMKVMHADIERIAKKIVDELLDSGDENEVDFVDKVAAPLPIAVIAWLLGVPESDWNLIYEWTNRTIGAGDPEYQKEGENAAQTGNAAMIELFGYFSKLVEEKRKNPADDLITVFTQAEVDGKKLEMMDILAWCQIIMVAGNETTTKFLNETMRMLIEQPEVWSALQADPSARIHGLVEEGLRLSAPNQGMFRYVTADTDLGGVQIPQGATLWLMFAAANRDATVFADAESFDLSRTNVNEHVAFGKGHHFCIGAPLSRLEGKVAFEELSKRIELPRFAPDNAFEYEPSYILRGLAQLDLHVTKRTKRQEP